MSELIELCIKHKYTLNIYMFTEGDWEAEICSESEQVVKTWCKDTSYDQLIELLIDGLNSHLEHRL